MYLFFLLLLLLASGLLHLGLQLLELAAVPSQLLDVGRIVLKDRLNMHNIRSCSETRVTSNRAHSTFKISIYSGLSSHCLIFGVQGCAQSLGLHGQWDV